MKSKGKTSQRTILFRQNINRDNEEWAHFLEGYREWLSLTPPGSGVPSRRGAAKPRGTKAPAFVNTRQAYPTAELYV